MSPALLPVQQLAVSRCTCTSCTSCNIFGADVGVRRPGVGKHQNACLSLFITSLMCRWGSSLSKQIGATVLYPDSTVSSSGQLRPLQRVSDLGTTKDLLQSSETCITCIKACCGRMCGLQDSPHKDPLAILHLILLA